ncbi:MAG: GtrA family protein [Clostridiales bacterium]|nr:GtrA family protein [Clostridiales bacterium]
MNTIRKLYKAHKDFIMEVIHFGMVGVMNTLLGWIIMAGLYNLAHFNYWLSSGISYFAGSVYSYYMNSRLTFKVEKKDKWLPWRFALNIILCYAVAFGAAKPAVRYLLASQPVVLMENVAMVLGMCLFIVMNFFGQKLFVFRRRDGNSKAGAAPED